MPATAVAVALAIDPCSAGAAGDAARAADAPPPIRVSVPACPAYPFAVEAFLGSLEVELAGQVPACCLLAPPGTAAATRTGAPGPLVTLAIEPCAASATAVSVHLHDPARAMDADRRVGLGDIPGEARPRALALAVAEMVHALLATPPPAPPAPPPPSPPPPEAGTATRLPGLFLTGTLEVESHPGNNMSLLGFAASAAAARGRWMAALDLQWMIADPLVDLGDVRTQLLAGALTAGPRFTLRRAIVDLGATGRFGWAWMSGHATGAGAVTSSGSAPVASAGARLGVFLPTSARVSHLRLMVEGGATLRGLEATVNGATAASLSGGYVLIGFGFGENR
jgi:hypothetical protein